MSTTKHVRDVKVFTECEQPKNMNTTHYISASKSCTLCIDFSVESCKLMLHTTYGETYFCGGWRVSDLPPVYAYPRYLLSMAKLTSEVRGGV
jgi:hypothetical protein